MSLEHRWLDPCEDSVRSKTNEVKSVKITYRMGVIAALAAGLLELSGCGATVSCDDGSATCGRPDVPSGQGRDSPWDGMSTGFRLQGDALGQARVDGSRPSYADVSFDRATRRLSGQFVRAGAGLGPQRAIDRVLTDAENTELLDILSALRSSETACRGFDGFVYQLQIATGTYEFGSVSCSLHPRGNLLNDGNPLLNFIDRLAM